MSYLLPRPPHREQPNLLRVLAVLGVLGCLSLIGGTFIAQQFVPDYNWISDTISDLAAGKNEIYMDVALYGFAAGLTAMALAAAHTHLGGAGWSAGVLSLAILAALVIVVGARNEYGDGDSEGVVIHIYLVYGLGVFFALAPWLMAEGAGEHHPSLRKLLRVLAIIWAASAPIFLFVPTSFDGLFERYLGLLACAIICTFAWLFWQRGGDVADRERW